MPNDFYNHAGYPTNSAEGKSVDMRAELLAITAAFNKLPALAGNANKLIAVNSSGNGLTTVAGALVAQTAWTPVITCSTPGNLTIVYSTQVGAVYTIGAIVIVIFDLQTSTFTHTTASGNIGITGWPSYTPGVTPMFAMSFSGFTKAGYTQMMGRLVSTSLLNIDVMGSGQAHTPALITDFPTGGTVILRGTAVYWKTS